MIPADTWQMLDRMGFNVLSVLLSILWQSTIVLAAAAALALLLRRRRASVRHALWVAALLAIPLLPLLGWLASSVQAPQAPLPVMPAYSPPPVAVERPAPAEQFIPPPAPIVPAELPQAKTFNVLSCPWALGLLAYAAGAGALLVLVIVGRIRIAAWLRKGQVVTDGRAIAILHAARQRLGLARDFTLVESPAVLTPVTVGVLHPAVLLPQGFAQKLSDEDLESVAIHELAHIKRRDPLLLALLSLVRAAFFFHPLVWLGCRQASTLAEAACDDAVLEATGQPLPYAKMLARLAEELPRRALATELAAGFVLSRGAFLRRIEAILSPRRDQIRRLSRLALALTLVAAIVSVGLALALPLGEKPAGPDADKDAAASAKTGVPPSENALPPPELKFVSVEEADEATERLAVEKVAKRFLEAVRDRDIPALEGLIGAREGWTKDTMLSLVTELMEYEYSGRQEQLTTIREVIVKGDFAAVRVDAPADPAREWGYVGVLLRRTDAGWRVAGVAGAAVHHLPPGTFRQWLDVMVAFQLAEGGWGWVVDRLLLYRLVPLKQPILAGTAPTLTVEVLNVSDETVFWECQNEITLGVALPGVIGGWLSPKFSYSVQIDGQWFQRTIITASSGSLDFGPGKQFLDTGIRLIGLELKDQTTHRALELKPGKHTVRVAFTAEGDKAVRAVSNPVEIMVLPSRPSLVFASGSLRPALDYPSKWAVYAQVPEKEITKVAAGQEAAFTLEAFSGRVFHGHVERVADRPVTSENVVTYEVVIPVADPDPKFKDGMTATITLMGGGSAAAAPPPPPAETKPAAAASAPGRLLFHGLDLANAPGTSQWKDLPDLFEERPPGSKSYEMRKGLQPVYQGLDGTVYYLPVRGIFYVQADPAGSSTLHYYGPFKGKPREQMRLPEDPSGEAKLDFLWNFPELHELDLSISEKALQRMIAEKGLRNTCTEDSKTKAYHVYRRDGENVIVMFDKDGKCAGVQRMRTDASQADRLFNGLGKDAKSLEVCLRVDKTVWKVGDDLALKADVRNTGQEAVALYVDGNNYWGIEVDGQWYSSDTTTTALVAPMLGPGEQFVDISVPPTWIPSALSHWYDCSDEVPWRRGKKQLTLEPGRHTIRVGVYPVLVDSGASEAKAAPSASGKPVDRILTVQVTPGKPVPAVSNAVEIEVQPAAPSVAPAR